MTRKTRDRLLTRLQRSGRHPEDWDGSLNVPLHRASTIAFESIGDYEKRPPRGSGRASYGVSGTRTHFAFQEAISELEGAADSITLSSGLAAVTMALQVFVEAGDHILVTDSIYFPGRRFCDRVLKRYGVETTYYDPLIGAGIEDLVRPNTKLIYMESPGSATFEVQDVPALVEVAKRHGIRTAFDNTWATPVYFRPIEFGVDVSIQAGTKYIGGHADIMLGYLSLAPEVATQVVHETLYHGHCCGVEEAYLGLRGLRSLAPRLAQHGASALKVARWLEARPEVARVLYPPLESDPGHALWQRDFEGGTGLLGAVLAEPYGKDAVAAMIDGYELFEIGASWGGFASLAVTAYPEKYRLPGGWEAPGPLIRYHIGLEDPDDLIADLEAGFQRLTQASGAT
ncbi:MAG: cystathionine beta-lyase [Limibacillus sp.]|jgi:cystathionine beta-lyase